MPRKITPIDGAELRARSLVLSLTGICLRLPANA